MFGKLDFTVTVLVILFIQSNVYAQEKDDDLLKQVLEESKRLGLDIDQSQITTRSNDKDGSVASVPLITGSDLKVTSEQIKKGDVYLSLQCMKSEKLNGCFRVRVTGVTDNGKELNLSLVDANGEIVASTKLSPLKASGTERLSIFIYIGPPIPVYIDGHYIGTFGVVIIISGRK